MEIKNYMRKFKKANITAEQVLADDIYNYFSKKLDYGRIRKMMKDKGKKFVYETFSEVKKADAENHLSLFIWKIGQQRILWEGVDNKKIIV